MSKSITIQRTTAVLFVLVVTAALIGADLAVSAAGGPQDPNSNMMQNDNMQNSNMSNTNANRGRGGRSRNRGRRGNRNANMANDNMSNDNMSGNMNMSGDQGSMNANMSGETQGNMNASVRMTERTDGGEQTDLSGTYTGNINYPEGGMTGDATLTITGNQFTLTSGSATQSGRVAANTTRGYTAVTMMFGGASAEGGAMPAGGTASAAAPAVSLRLRRTGECIRLNSVPGERREFSFNSCGAASGGTRRGRRGRRPAVTEPSAPAEPATPAEPMQTPAEPTPTTEPTPEPTPSPTPKQ